MRLTPALYAAGAACALSLTPEASAQLLFEDVYTTTFTRGSGDNLYISDSNSNIIRQRNALGAILGLYAPFAQNASEIGAALDSSGPLTLDFGPTDSDQFGSVGDTVNFNPLATGGTVDIATGGDYVDQQLSNANGAAFSIIFARVDVENEVFRQDFGPVQTQTRDGRGSASFDIRWRALTPWDASFFPVDSEGRTPEYRVSFDVVPTPGVLATFGVGGLALVRRRRH